MAWPTKTLASLGNNQGQGLPTRFFHDPSESDPFVVIVDDVGRALAFAINTAALVGSTGKIAAEFEVGEISATELAADAVEAGKIAEDAIPDSAAIVKIFSANAFDAAALVDVFVDNGFTEAVVDALFAAGAIDAADRLKAASIGSDRIASKAIADDRLASFLVKESGRIAMGLIDFNAEGDADSTVTIGAVTYLEKTGPAVTSGEWENGGSAAASATSLAAAINGDTRASLVYAGVAVGTSVWVFALAVGTDGNQTISATGTDPDVVDNLIGGAAAAVKEVQHYQHVVTAEEATQVQVLIPLPFDAAFFEFHVYDTNGGILATEVTDRGTVVNTAAGIPAYFQLLTNGATHISSGDIIRLTVQS